MAWAPALAGLAGSVIGDMMSQQGQSDANATNMAIADKQMLFQREMSDTAMTRRVRDLKMAGLNPLLAVGEGGASSPSGAALPVQNTATAWGNLGQQVQGAAQSMAQIRLTNAAAASQEIDNAAKGGLPGSESKTRADMLLEGQIDNLAGQYGLNKAQAANFRESTQNLVALRPKIEADATSAASQASVSQALAEAQLEFAKIGNILATAKEPEAKAEAEFYQKLSAMGTEGSQSLIRMAIQMLLGLRK